jgi:hypothetical protein
LYIGQTYRTNSTRFFWDNSKYEQKKIDILGRIIEAIYSRFTHLQRIYTTTNLQHLHFITNKMATENIAPQSNIDEEKRYQHSFIQYNWNAEENIWTPVLQTVEISAAEYAAKVSLRKQYHSAADVYAEFEAFDNSLTAEQAAEIASKEAAELAVMEAEHTTGVWDEEDLYMMRELAIYAFEQAIELAQEDE